MLNRSALKLVPWGNLRFTAGQSWACIFALIHLRSCLIKSGIRTEECKSFLGKVQVIFGLTQIITVLMPHSQKLSYSAYKPRASVFHSHGFAQHLLTDAAQSNSWLSGHIPLLSIHVFFESVLARAEMYSLFRARRGLSLHHLYSCFHVYPLSCAVQKDIGQLGLQQE